MGIRRLAWLLLLRRLAWLARLRHHCLWWWRLLRVWRDRLLRRDRPGRQLRLLRRRLLLLLLEMGICRMCRCGMTSRMIMWRRRAWIRSAGLRAYALKVSR